MIRSLSDGWDFGDDRHSAIRPLDRIVDEDSRATPKTLSLLIKAIHVVLAEKGVLGDSGVSASEVKEAILPVEGELLFTNPPSTAENPKVIVVQPLGEFARRTRWGYAVHYHMQDASASRDVLVLSGEMPTGIVDFADGHPERMLAEDEATQITADLTRLGETE